MKILVSGCSHSTVSLKSKSYGEFLGEMLGCEVDNISSGAKDNQQIFTDTVKYLRNNEQPDIVIVQWTEFHRVAFLKNEASKRYCGDDYHTMEDWTKTHIPVKFNCYDVWEDGARDIQVGHDSYLTNKMDVMAYYYGLKSMVKKLIVLNWHGFYEAEGTKFGSSIDPTDMLIENYRYGLSNHLKWCAYKRHDGFHFEESANRYIAERLCNFIVKGEQIVVEDVPFDSERVVFNYI